MYRRKRRQLSVISCVFVLIFITGTFGTFHAIARNTGKTIKTPTVPVAARIAKWYNNCDAAISLTYDEGNPASELNRKINTYLIKNRMTMDYEVVTHDYRLYPHLKTYLLNDMIPAGLSYFGHGHKHINHDKVSYQEALASFKRCYKAMREFGLQPVAYAYPKGAGNRPETRKALEEAGFLSGRLHFTKEMTHPYIMPGAQTEPVDWYALPTLVMQDYDFSQCQKCVNNNEELILYLDEALRQNAWLILTYHAIGFKQGYGHYKLVEFKHDIRSIKERHFWNASMNAVTLYTRERQHAEVSLAAITGRKKHIKEVRIIVTDGLTDPRYDQPLTILLDVPEYWNNQTLALVEKGKIIAAFKTAALKGMISIKPDGQERRIIPTAKRS